MIYEAIDLWNSPSLEHHGVKGMKWGVRKQRESLGNRLRSWRTKRHENYIRKNFGEAAVIEGRKEDAASYKYQKSGESGAVGLARATGNFVKSHKKEIAIGAAVAVGAAAAIAIAKDPGFTVKQVPVMYTRLNPNSHLGKAMKTPVAFITKGKSTIRSNVYRRGAVNRNNADFVNWQRRTAKSAMNNMYATPAQNAAARNAYLHYGGGGGTYRPRYVTNKGGAVSKRLERWNGKTRVLRRTNSWS